MNKASRLPRLFVGSSSEGIEIANAIQENLEFDAETIVWTQGIFKPTRHALADLVATFNPARSDGNLLAALGSACNQLRRALREAALPDAPVAGPAVVPTETAQQKLDRLVGLWGSDALKRDRTTVSQGMPMWIGEDEDGTATEAFTRICTFLDSVADTVLAQPAVDAKARAVFGQAMLNAWKVASTYFVNFAHSSVDEHWERHEYPPMKELAERWGRSQ
ncbi:MAG: hypothetical protein H7346_06360 [Burkholderiaceae bacterium]|nr:hypothetical protein [Burkholderiaceae bacterium]